MKAFGLHLDCIAVAVGNIGGADARGVGAGSLKAVVDCLKGVSREVNLLWCPSRSLDELEK